MKAEPDFVDYYKALQVEFDCDARTLELAYHFLAKMFHPDNFETADVEKFSEIISAYKVLRDAERRAEYDRAYLSVIGKPTGRSILSIQPEVDERTAFEDDEVHGIILRQLYKQRRARASEPGVAGWYLQNEIRCSEDELEFHVWYLKAKGFIEVTEQGTLAITADGVDHVISTSREAVKERLLIASGDSESSS